MQIPLFRRHGRAARRAARGLQIHPSGTNRRWATVYKVE